MYCRGEEAGQSRKHDHNGSEQTNPWLETERCFFRPALLSPKKALRKTLSTLVFWLADQPDSCAFSENHSNGLLQPQSLLTATGSRRIRTGFPVVEGPSQRAET